MRLTWTNSEWDNFGGVASKDNLMMLEAGDDFLNATGDNTMLDEKEIKRRIRNLNPIAKKDVKWNIVTDPTQTQIDGAKAYYNGILKYDAKTSLDVLNSLLEKANYELTQWKNQENTGKDGIRYSNSTDKSEISTIQQAGKAKANIRALDSYIITNIQTAIAKAVALKEKADALKEKADADAKAKAQADADAKAEADRIAKMKSLNDQLINAKTPEEKKSIQAQIDALAGNVAKGGSKYLTYGIIGLVVVVGAFMLFKRNN
jgi:hypothetical protein